MGHAINWSSNFLFKRLKRKINTFTELDPINWKIYHLVSVTVKSMGKSVAFSGA